MVELNPKVLGLLKYYKTHPYEYVIDILKANPSNQQEEILKAIPKAIEDRKGIAVKSGHGVGKTCIAAWIIHWFMSTRYHPKVPCTAPTQHQLYDVLWSELKKWMYKSMFKDMFEWTATKFYNKKHPNTWFAVARTTNKPEGLQGFHAENLLFIADEASGVPVEIHEVIEGSQTQKGSIYIMLGNPTQLSGGFYDAFHSKRAFYKCFTLSTLETAAERPDIADVSYGSKIAAKYGEDSDIYRVRVLGEFPRAESGTLISLDMVEKAAMRSDEFVGPYEVIEIGVDVARFGDDETTIWKRIGNTITKENILRKRDTMYVSGQVALIVKKYHQLKTVYVNVDDSGVGGGVTDRLTELCETGELNATINGVNNGSRAFSPSIYINKGTEMWFFMKQWLKTGSIENDEDLIAQLSTRRYRLNSAGKNQMERKEEMKNRGLTSPDRADGAILTLLSLIHAPKNDSNRSYVC